MRWMLSMIVMLMLCIGLHVDADAQTTAPANTTNPALDQTFQYAVPMTGMAAGKTAYLWIPEKTKKVRGVLIGGSVVIETNLVRSKAIREVCAENDLAIVYMVPHPFGVFPYDQLAVVQAFEQVLVDLAKASHHPEIAKTPVMTFGHSVSTVYAQRVAYWNPDRVFGVMLFKGGLGPALPSTPEAHLEGVPLFLLQGQFEEFGPGPHGALRDFEDRTTGWRTGMAAFLSDRSKDPELLYGYIVHAGGTHYEWPIAHESLIAEFIRACASLRLPEQGAEDPTKLKHIDYKTQGALVDAKDLLRGSQGKKQPKVTEGQLWYPSQKMADAVVKLHDQMGLKPQYVAPTGGKKNRPVPVGHDMRLKHRGITWTAPDVFQVKAAYLKGRSKKYPKEVEGEVGNSGQPILMRVMAGNIIQVGPGQFRVTSDMRWGNRVHVNIYSLGNEEYRHTAQHAKIDVRFKKGETQEITDFNLPEEVKLSELPLMLSAKASSGLPVYFYVDHGPAKVNVDGALIMDQWPSKAGDRMQVKVVAYRVGSIKSPQYQSAEPVSKTITLVKD